MADSFTNTLTGPVLGTPSTTEKQTYAKHVVVPTGETMTITFSGGVGSGVGGSTEVFGPDGGDETTLVITVKAVKRG